MNNDNIFSIWADSNRDGDVYLLRSQGKTQDRRLEVTIKNPDPFPEDSLKITPLSQVIGSMMKKNLQDQEGYDVLRVSFFQEKTNGWVTARARKTISFMRDDL